MALDFGVKNKKACIYLTKEMIEKKKNTNSISTILNQNKTS